MTGRERDSRTGGHAISLEFLSVYVERWPRSILLEDKRDLPIRHTRIAAICSRNIEKYPLAEDVIGQWASI